MDVVDLLADGSDVSCRPSVGDQAIEELLLKDLDDGVNECAELECKETEELEGVGASDGIDEEGEFNELGGEEEAVIDHQHLESDQDVEPVKRRSLVNFSATLSLIFNPPCLGGTWSSFCSKRRKPADNP